MPLLAADLFCGAGGTSTGLVKAAKARGLTLSLTAVNHWKMAVDTHELNHPWARHVCADLASVDADPNTLIPSGRLDILVASPECTHHSIARGGKPCSNQSRASAWHVLHWAERLHIKDILIENVKEFKDWGPLTSKGRPDQKHKGETFQAFVTALRSMGYKVEWRILNAADYGDATSRRRLFLRASKSAIRWPEPTHVFKWRGAREIIDWSIKGKSIFTRKRPLASRTLQRIEAGLKKFGKPFIVQVAHAGGDRVRSLEEPLPTIPAGHRGELALIEPFIMKYYGNEMGAYSVKEPLGTITTKDRFGLIEPCSGDILFRMLQPHELAAAMGFDNYKFAGTKTDSVKMIGNAVAVNMATALCGSIMDAA